MSLGVPEGLFVLVACVLVPLGVAERNRSPSKPPAGARSLTLLLGSPAAFSRLRLMLQLPCKSFGFPIL